MVKKGNLHISTYSISCSAHDDLHNTWKYAATNDVDLSKSEIVDAAILSFCSDPDKVYHFVKRKKEKKS